MGSSWHHSTFNIQRQQQQPSSTTMNNDHHHDQNAHLRYCLRAPWIITGIIAVISYNNTRASVIWWPGIRDSTDESDLLCHRSQPPPLWRPHPSMTTYDDTRRKKAALTSVAHGGGNGGSIRSKSSCCLPQIQSWWNGYQNRCISAQSLSSQHATPPPDQHLDKNWKTRKRVQVKGRGMTKVSIVQVHGILHEMFQDIILSWRESK